jgi:phosphate transport system protein
MKGERPSSFAGSLSAMAAVDQAQLRDAMGAFDRRDADQVDAIFARDDEVDQLYVDVVREVQKTIQGDMTFLERGVHVLAVAKFLERIGDHITNLAELVIFLVRGKDIRHLGKLEEE